MGKDLKGKDLGVGITQQKNGLYNFRTHELDEKKLKMQLESL